MNAKLLRVAVVLSTILAGLTVAQTSVPVTAISATYSSHQSISLDPVTGRYYQRDGYSGGAQVSWFADRASFESGSVGGVHNLQGGGGYWGTYVAVIGGKLFGRTSNSGTDTARWNLASGVREVSSPAFPNMCGTNGSCTFQWGGFSGVNFMYDGLDLYVFGKNVGAGWQLNRLDNDLNVIQTWQHPASTLGYAFMINGFLFTAPQYQQHLIDTAIDTGTGMQTAVNFTLTGGPGSPYWGCTVYDPVDDVLYIHSRDASATYRVDNASSAFNVPGGRVEITVVDATPTEVAPGQTGATVSFEVTNNGMGQADVTSTNLFFTDAAMVDVSSDYVVTPDPMNPTFIAPAGTETFLFTVDVAAMAALGTVTVNGEISGLDILSARPFTRRGASTPDSWDVVSALAAVRTVDALPMTVSQGGGSYQVDVTVENPGLVALDVFGVLLRFTGTADRTAEYTITPDVMNPSIIAPGVTESFRFGVDVDSQATTEIVTIDADFSGRDGATLALLFDIGADTTNSWDVIACGASLCGDCNLDGMISIVDALLAAQIAAGLVTPTAQQFTNCNVSGLVEPDPSASVDILDGLALAQSAAGLGTVLSCC